MTILPFRRPAPVRDWVSRYTYNACPDGVERSVSWLYDVDVVMVDHGTGPADGRVWMVRAAANSCCLNRDGVWVHEPIDPYKTDQWRQEHLFDLDAARYLATQEAPNLTVDRVPARDVRPPTRTHHLFKGAQHR